MNDYITISELSKLMNVSVHQIRYFEEKEILFPSYTDTNQYRMYGINEIYQLAQILLLRKLNLPVSTIKKCLTSFSTDDYHQLLRESLGDINDEIDRLKTLQQFIQKILNEHDELDNLNNEYHIKYVDTRHLKQWTEFGENETLNAKKLYNQRPQTPHLFETDLHYLYDSNQVTLCFETTQSADIILEKGSYLCKPFLVKEDQDMEHEIQQLEQYVKQHQYDLSSEIIIIEKSYLSMFSNNELNYEIQVKVNHDRKGDA